MDIIGNAVPAGGAIDRGAFEHQGSVGVHRAPQTTPSQITLQQNYPNPFNPSTSITYAMPSDQNVLLEVYNVLGMKVRTLVDGAVAAGSYRVAFDAGSLPAGMYLYRLTAGGMDVVRRMALLK